MGAASAETVPNNLNPRFTSPVLVDFYFEEVTYIKFEARLTPAQRSTARATPLRTGSDAAAGRLNAAPRPARRCWTWTRRCPTATSAATTWCVPLHRLRRFRPNYP